MPIGTARRRFGIAAVVALSALAFSGAQAAAQAGPVTALDRAVVRYMAPELGGARSPRFVFQRALAFEARLEALADPDRSPGDSEPYRERHVRAALERNIAENLLASLRMEPEPTASELVRQSDAARAMLVARVGGAELLDRAARAEGIEEREILRMLRRSARASLYLHRMVAPMLLPSDAELRNLHRSVQTPFRDLPYERAAVPLRRWYVGRRLSEALASFYQNARSRLQIVFLD
ncbi:MAG TPA: hypothetical protein VK524_03270 [Polyangiaceae bacterium]|nr:hypothetical protein [Polyangiaceae bacterium]